MWEDEDNIDIEKEMDLLEDMNEDLKEEIEEDYIDDEIEDNRQAINLLDTARKTKLTQKYFDQQVNIKLESSKDLVAFIYREEEIVCKILNKLTTGIYVVLQILDNSISNTKMRKIIFKEIELI